MNAQPIGIANQLTIEKLHIVYVFGKFVSINHYSDTNTYYNFADKNQFSQLPTPTSHYFSVLKFLLVYLNLLTSI